MSINWKRALVAGVAIFLYSLIMQNFLPDLNIYLTALLGAIVGGGSVKFAEIIFQK